MSIPGSAPPSYTGMGQPPANMMGPAQRSFHSDTVGRPSYPIKYFEIDDSGARFVRGEVLAISPSEASFALLRSKGFTILGSDSLDSLGINLVVFQPPSGMKTGEALAELRAADPSGLYDVDRIYDPAGDSVVDSVQITVGPAMPAAGAMGIVDGGIDLDHPDLQGANIETFGAVSDKPLATNHGTAIASLLVGTSDDGKGVAPGMKLFAADVFGGTPTGGSAEDVARGLDWLAGNNVPVVSISLMGPRNTLVEMAIKTLIARGVIVVAAVGNGGSAVSYPAAYDGVVAVTSVDSGHAIQRDANQGPQVMFSASGVAVRAARAGGHYDSVTGTSFAAPVVAAALARSLKHPDPVAAKAAIASLQNSAVDLGAPGRDPIYGYGLLAAQ
jgi:hypothetical protein